MQASKETHGSFSTERECFPEVLVVPEAECLCPVEIVEAAMMRKRESNPEWTSAVCCTSPWRATTADEASTELRCLYALITMVAMKRIRESNPQTPTPINTGSTHR
jgi:hypothetical protein